MTWLEWAVYATGVAAIVSAVPLIRALRSNLQLARARVFLRWRSYTRTLRVAAFVGALFILVLMVDDAIEPNDYIEQVFVPVGVFQLLIEGAAAYYGWTIYRIARGPRPSPAAGALLLLAPGLGMRALLVAAGVPAVAILLVLALRVPYESEVVKARYYLQFQKTNRVTENIILAAMAGLAVNLVLSAVNPGTLHHAGVLASTGVGILIVHVGFILIAWFVTFTMRGLLLRGSART